MFNICVSVWFKTDDIWICNRVYVNIPAVFLCMCNYKHFKKTFDVSVERLDKVLLVVMFLYENILYVCVVHIFVLETKRQSYYYSW